MLGRQRSFLRFRVRFPKRLGAHLCVFQYCLGRERCRRGRCDPLCSWSYGPRLVVFVEHDVDLSGVCGRMAAVDTVVEPVT